MLVVRCACSDEMRRYRDRGCNPSRQRYRHAGHDWMSEAEDESKIAS